MSGLEAVSIFRQVESDETAFKRLETYVYRKAKFRLASDIKFTLRFMETFIDRTLNGYMKEIENIINNINAFIDKYKDGSEERHEAWIDQADEVLLGLIRKRVFQPLLQDEVAAS